jgi:hypothetical protein
MKMAVFWVVTPCSLVEVCRLFRDACCLHHQGDRPWRNNSENSHIQVRVYFVQHFAGIKFQFLYGDTRNQEAQAISSLDLYTS